MRDYESNVVLENMNLSWNRSSISRENTSRLLYLPVKNKT
nr:MAG TPA: hypothetical protein [Caudoviricetes sp.]